MTNYDDYVDALIEKSEDAFEYIYHETKHSVYALIVSIVKSRVLAEDIMQETYIKMISSIKQYQKGRNFKTWLLTIARNLAIDEYRKKQKETLIDITEQEFIFPSVHASGEESLLIRELLQLMTDEERQVFLLHVVDDIKHKEIAKIMNKPLGTILWLYQKALKKVK
jgi:RNA polymerase sigma-70 factor (ECF subfamily)